MKNKLIISIILAVVLCLFISSCANEHTVPKETDNGPAESSSAAESEEEGCLPAPFFVNNGGETIFHVKPVRVVKNDGERVVIETEYIWSYYRFIKPSSTIFVEVLAKEGDSTKDLADAFMLTDSFLFYTPATEKISDDDGPTTVYKTFCPYSFWGVAPIKNGIVDHSVMSELKNVNFEYFERIGINNGYPTESIDSRINTLIDEKKLGEPQYGKNEYGK